MQALSDPPPAGGAPAVATSDAAGVLSLVGRGGGTALDPTTRADMEARLGEDFSGVRVHTGSEATASARSVRARAYTVGDEVVFAAGAYAPGTAEGRSTLAHELTHVRQQRRGAVAGTEVTPGLAVSDPADPFEREARGAAERVLAGGRPPVGLRPSLAPAVAPAAGPVVAQRDGAPAPPPPAGGGANPPAPATPTIADLDKAISDGDRDLIVTTCGKLSQDDKNTLLNERKEEYKAKLAKALSSTQIKYAAHNLGARLKVIFEWMSAAAFLTSNIDYKDVKELVQKAGQPERDELKNDGSKEFFRKICTATTIFEAVDDLGFTVDVKLEWIRNETSLSYDKAMKVMDAVPGDAAAKTAAWALVTVEPKWRKFWVDVCSKDEMRKLVDISFPTDLRKKLEWMGARGTSFEAIKAKIDAPSFTPPQGLALYDSNEVKALLVSECSKAEMVEVVSLIGGTWAQQKDWVTARKASLLDLAVALKAKNKIADATLKNFVDACRGRKAEDARSFVANLPDADVSVLRGRPETMDIVHDAFGSDSGPVEAALGGQVAKGDTTKKVDEQLTVDQGAGMPFKVMKFGGDHRFTINYSRTFVEVDVGIDMSTAMFDSHAKDLLPASKVDWMGRIMGAWNNKFKFVNDKHPNIPLRFTVSFDGGPNSVTVHSGLWVWPKLNASNWFVPDPTNPDPKIASQAPQIAQAPVHEFGHLIGNPDEYDLDASHYLGTTGSPVPAAVPAPGTAGAPVTGAADPTGKVDPSDPTGVLHRYTVQNSVMGGQLPATVLARHVQNILDWVNAHRQSAESAFTIQPMP